MATASAGLSLITIALFAGPSRIEARRLFACGIASAVRWARRAGR